MDLIKQQHYVWKEYLRNWSNQDKISTYYKNDNKVETTNLNQLAKQRFFYRFNKFSKFEILFFKSIIESSPKPIKKFQEELLNHLIKFNEIEDIYKLNNESNSNIFKNGFEPLHTIIESQGKKLINCRNIKDLKLFDNELNKTEALMFLYVQYCRTKKRRDDIRKNNFGNQDIVNFDNMFSFLSILMGMNMGCNLSLDNTISFKLLTIKNDLNFITSDQPAINLLSEIKDENNNVKDLLIYYPLSPKHALKIDFKKDSHKYTEYYPSENEIHELNSQLLKESNLYIFAENEATLKIVTHSHC